MDDRRTFLKTAAAAAIATQARPILGANDRVNLAVVGLGGRGRDHVNTMAATGSARLGALCDVNQAALERAQAMVGKLQGHKAKEYRDMRKLFEDREIDAVSIATPNHWHSLSTIWACQAGKDVYIEKPASHNIFEGRQMLAAARKHKRMVQVGSQSRTIGHKIEAMRLLHEGAIGKVYLARGLCYRWRRSIGRTPVTEVPPGIDWDLFLGPAPMRPFTMNRFAYNWHWFWDTGNGDIGNQGVHEMDICLWGLKPEKPFPKAVSSTGGKYLWDDDQETPNTQTAVFEYGGAEIQFEVRNLQTLAEGNLPFGGPSLTGNLFFGREGVMEVHPQGFTVYKGEKREVAVQEKQREQRTWDPQPHMQNFLDAVKHRDHRKLTADVEVGVAAAALCHLANIAYRTGRRLTVDPEAERFVADPEANQMLTRDYRSPYVVAEIG